MRCGLVAAALAAGALLGCGKASSSPASSGTAGMPSTGGATSTAGQAGNDAVTEAGGSHESSPLLPNQQTLWGMFAFEDPVAIELSSDGEQLFGSGCFAGRPTPTVPNETCQPLVGTIDGRHLEFAFQADDYLYQADVYISRDARRMAGAFHGVDAWQTNPTAWLPLEANDAWLPQPDIPAQLKAVLPSLSGHYTLGNSADSSATELASLTVSDGTTGRGVVLSGLGAFWDTEVHWNEAEQTLTAGPVPETAPELPVQLTLHFESTRLVKVDALLASGEIRAFSAVPRSIFK